MEAARFVATASINLWADKGKRKTPMQMFPFPHDPKGILVTDLDPDRRKKIEEHLKANPPKLDGKQGK